MVKQPVSTNKINSTPEPSNIRRKSVNGTPVTVIVVPLQQPVLLLLIMAHLAQDEVPLNDMLAMLAQRVEPSTRISNSNSITEKGPMMEGEEAKDTKTIGKNIMQMVGVEAVLGISRITINSSTCEGKTIDY